LFDEGATVDHKTLALVEGKVDASGSGSFTGYASLFGVLDSQNDVVMRGAYTATLPQFLERGFIAWGHDWNDPVATIADAQEDDRGLYLMAEFHSDEASQRARTRTMERIARGKFMGLSIGFQIADAGYDDAGVRLLKAIDLYETSLVTVPALRDAGVTSAKGRFAPEDAVPATLAELAAFIAECKSGRAISAARRTRLEALRDQLHAGADDLHALLAETAPDDGKAARRLLAECLAIQARGLGVAV
jgi:HK97 family phage prohead protease